MNKYEFIYPHTKETTIRRILINTQRPKLVRENAIFAKVARNKKSIRLYHETPFRNSFRPIFHIKLIELDEHETLAKGSWRWSIFVYIWYLLASIPLTIGIASSILSRDYVQTFSWGLFCLFFAGVGVFGVWIERKRMAKVIEHMQKSQSL